MRHTRISKILGIFVLLLAGVIAVQSPVLYAAGQSQQQPPLIPTSGHSASLNWAGYSAANGVYTSVSASWIVPKVADVSVGRADAAWVGIGGMKSRDLIQAGTQAVVTRRGVEYQAWYEMLPDVSIPVELAVSPGDSVTTSITETSSGVWHIVIHNNTTGKEYSNTVNYDSSHSSVEWIEERVSGLDGSFYPLNDFGSITFENAVAEVDGQFKSLSGLGAKLVTMTSGSGQILATTSQLNPSGAFTVSRTNAQSQPTPTFAVTPSQDLSDSSSGDGGVVVITIGPDGITIHKSTNATAAVQGTQVAARHRRTYRLIQPSAAASVFDLLWR